MKILKLLGGLLIFIILVTVALSFLSADHQKVQRSIEINKDPKTIYDQLSRLENFNKIAVWNQQDSSASFSISGKDGEVGASTSWKGHPMISGEGRITITGLTPPTKIIHLVEFSKPKKGKADSIFELSATNINSTLVTWTFDLHTPRPWNIFNLFYSLDKEKGVEFENGLKLLKAMIEK